MAEARLLNVRCGDTLYVFDSTTQDAVILQVRKIAQKSGHEIRWPDGRREWYFWRAKYDPSKTGSACYTWHADGNRVWHELHKIEIVNNGDSIVTIVRRGWRQLED